jgi:hypothetical protein
MQPALIVVDEDAGRDVHRVDEHESLADTAGRQGLLDLWRDVDEAAPCGHVEPQLLPV